jgi:TonB family protein
MMPSLTNVAAYSIQLAVCVLAALAIVRAVRLRDPLASLRFWQAILAASVGLAVAQPHATEGTAVIGSGSLASFVSAVNIDGITVGSSNLAQWLVLIVVAGIAIRLLWLAIGVARLRTITRSASRDGSLDPLLGELSASLRTHATIAISDAVESPSTVGVRRPLILLPRRVLSMPPSVQRAVIAHELVHVRRRDWLHTIAEEVWCALLWFHPAARLIASRLSLARETLVDQTTILLTRDRRAYAEALLAFANPQPYLPGVTPLIGRRHLSQRISLIAEEEVMSRSRLVVSFAIAVFVCAAATVSAVNTVPMTTEPGPTQVYEPGNGITLPSVVREVKPSYTREAMQRKIQGSVWLSIVVGETGDVTDVKVSKSLDPEYGLDNEAMKAAWQWKFKPGTKGGKPVPVRVTLELTFTLKK